MAVAQAEAAEAAAEAAAATARKLAGGAAEEPPAGATTDAAAAVLQTESALDASAAEALLDSLKAWEATVGGAPVEHTGACLYLFPTSLPSVLG